MKPKASGSIMMASLSIQQAQKAQKIVVDKLQNGRDAIKQMGLDRDWTQDVEQKKHMHNKYMQGIGYSEEAQEAMRNEAYMPVTMTQIYQQSKAMKDKIGGHNYDADSKIAASKTQYPVNESAGYEMQKNLAKKNSDYKKEYYNTRHENNMGKALAGTAQVQQAAKNQTNASDNQYKIGAAELRRLVQLNESPELTQARVNAHNLSRKAYKAGYIAMINSKKENRKLEDFPEYMAAKKAASAASKVLYELEAKAMAEHPLGIQKDHASIVNAKKTTDILNETKYKESMTANNESSKGYMTMDADVHPVVVQSNYKKAMQTNYGYSKEAQDMMTEPDYPVSETEFYKQKKMLAPFMSIKNYRETADNDNQRPKFDQSKTEKYQQDRNLNKTISGYKTIIHEQRGFEEALAETPLMEQAAKDKINNSETRYRAGNRKMMENYKPELDTPLNRQARLNQQHISRIEYKKAHAKYLADHEKVRKLMDHPEYVQARTIQKMTQDSLYKQAAMQANATPVGIQLDTPSVKLAKQNQENVSDRLYVKDLPDTNAKYKGFQTMDAASHPIVTKSAYFNTMNSDARYVQDSKEEQAEIYYPVNMTPGYEQQKTVQPYNSDKHYKKDLNNNKDYQYNYATTEHYEQNKTLDKVKTNYDAQFAEQKGQNTQFSKGFIESDQYNALKNVSKNVSDSLYTTGAKEALKRNCIPVDSMTNEHIKKAQEISSDLKYHEGYEHSVKGKLEAKPIDCHLDYIQSAANQTNVSDNAYQREGEKLKHQYTMVRDDLHIDHPIRVSEHVNDRAYYQSRIDTIDKYKGYMTMEASKHPLVTKAAHDNMLMSEAGYRQEWNDEKVEPMFCPNVTEGYQLTAKLKETLGTAYTRKANKEREACFFDAATTQQYEDQRKLKNLTDVQYKKNYLTEIAAGKGYQHMPAVTQEMEQIKNLKPYQSDAIYSRAAKALSGKYNLTIDDHLLTHQMKVSDITSERLYKKGYVDQLLGKTAQDAGIAYPRLLELTQQAKELNEQNYQKAARENHRSHNVGVDAMVMAQQKLNSQVVDNYNYSKTRREVVASMKHYQTMDASLHPITLKKNLDQMLYSNAGYVQDWNEDKIEIDFRADGTPIYETVQSLKAFTDANYKYKAKKTMSENTFNVAQTETYDTIRKLKEVQAQKYKAHATELNEHPKGIDKDETMDISQKLAPVLSQHRYTEAAKKLAEKYNINMDTMSIVQAMKVSEAVNNRLYVAGYKAQIVGKAPQDQQLANYPVEKSQYDLAKVVGNKAYTEAGNKIKMSGKLPLDCIAFKHAENSALIASDALYKKSRVEVIAKMKAWQNMDSSLHPIVQEKNYQNALNSNALYTKEAKEDLEAPMFLAQSTEFYEQNKKLKEVMGNYKKKAQEIAMENKYDYAQTDMYATAKTLKITQPKNYTANAVELMMKPKGDVSNPEMDLAKTLAPFTKSLYGKEAKRLQEKYSLDMDDMAIAHSLHCSDIINKHLYLAGYKNSIVGKSSSCGKVENFPSEYLGCRNTKNQSEAAYRAAGNIAKTTGKLPLDYMEFKRSTNAALIASDALYRKSRDQVISKHKAWQTMDYTTHPLVISAQLNKLKSSNALYREDAINDLKDIYYPVWLTEGYEVARKVTEDTSNKKYTKDAKKIEASHKFTFKDTDVYSTSQMMKGMSKQKYEAEARLAMVKDCKPEAETYEMTIAKTLAPYKSTLYDRAAKTLAEKYSLTMDSQSVAAALAVSEKISDRLYKQAYNDQIKGTAPADQSLENYQTELNAVKNSRNQSNALYKRDGLKGAIFV